MAVSVGDHRYAKFKIGQDLECIVSFYHYNTSDRTYYCPDVNEISGSGPMYNNSWTDFKFIAYSENKTTWYSSNILVQEQWGYIKDLSYSPDNYNAPAYLTGLYYSNITSIAVLMFNGWNVASIMLPSTLINIESSAFMESVNSSQDVFLTLPPNIRTIGSNAFSFCPGIRRISFRNTQLTLYDLTDTNRKNVFYISGSPVRTKIYIGDSSLNNVSYWQSQNRDIGSYLYICHDSVNGDQQFPLLETPPSNQPYKIYSIIENGSPKNLYLPLVDINDTVNGGNRVQYVPGVGSFRFKK